MKKKILIVDDEKSIREMLAVAFRKDYQVLLAEDGQAGVDSINIHHPDLIITDLTMPGMRGEEVVRLVKKDPTTKIKVIVLSGDTELKPVVEAAGCDVFLPKPYDLLALREEVERLLGG